MNEILYEPTSPWLLRLTCSHAELTEFLWASAKSPPSRVATRLFRGTRMRTEQELFNEISAACQFPDYFGDNWAALDECITDLGWLPADSYILAISDFNKLPTNLGTQSVGILLRLLNDAGKEWSLPVDQNEEWDRPSRAFHTILHSVPGNSIQLDAALKYFELDYLEIKR